MEEKEAIVNIEQRIFVIRGQRVMLDRDLAQLYGVQTFRLNESVKRNIKHFPDDFMFQLNKDELKELVANCDRFERLKHFIKIAKTQYTKKSCNNLYCNIK